MGLGRIKAAWTLKFGQFRSVSLLIQINVNYKVIMKPKFIGSVFYSYQKYVIINMPINNQRMECAKQKHIPYYSNYDNWKTERNVNYSKLDNFPCSESNWHWGFIETPYNIISCNPLFFSSSLIEESKIVQEMIVNILNYWTKMKLPGIYQTFLTRVPFIWVSIKFFIVFRRRKKHLKWMYSFRKQGTNERN